MSKPLMDVGDVGIETFDGKSGRVQALLDSGSYYTIIREERLPSGAMVIPAFKPRTFGTAQKSGQISVTGTLDLTIEIQGHPISTQVLVSPDLRSELIIGAGTMQSWDISIVNVNGHTEVRVGHDMNDPDIQEID